MFRYLTSIILIGISVAVFLLVTKPVYQSMGVLKETQSTHNEALGNSKAFEKERDRLTKQYGAINPDSLARVEKLLPDNVDNIRLILEIEKLAQPYGIALRDVKYNATTEAAKKEATTGAISGGNREVVKNTSYGSWDLEFSISTNYNNFISFTKDLENNLRIVDITSLQFDATSGATTNKSLPEVYRFSYKIKTYWLKN